MKKNSIHIIFNANCQSKNAILKFIHQNIQNNPKTSDTTVKLQSGSKNSETVLIVDNESALKQIDFPCPIFSINDLIPTNSPIEENIYRLSHHYKNFFCKKFTIKFSEINLLEDELHNHNFESVIKYANAYLMMQKQFNHVIFAFSFSPSIYFQKIITLAKQYKLAEKRSVLNFNQQKNALTQFMSLRGYVADCFAAYFGGLRREASNPSYNSQSNPIILNSALNKQEQSNKNEVGPINQDKFQNPCLIMTSMGLLYRKNFKPVYLKLSQRLSKNIPVIAATPEGFQAAQEDGIPVINLDHFENSSLFSQIIPMLLLSIKSISKMIYYRFILSHLRGKNFLRDIWLHQATVIFSAHRFLHQILKSYINTKKLDFLFKTINPTILYKDVTKTVYDARIAQLAKNHGIPVATSVVASLDSRYRNFGIYPCDFITILGENQRSIFKKFAYRDEQIIVVGQPELDIAKEKWQMVSANTYISEHISYYNPEKFMLLIATSPIDRIHEKHWIKTASECAAQQEKPIQILIKPHPSVGNFYADCADLKHVTVLPHDTEIYPFLVAANLVITDVSHSGKLAIFFRKPLMVVNFSGKKFPYNNFDEEGVAWLATNEQEIYEVIDGVMDQKLVINPAAYDAYIQQHLTSDDGRASDRIVDLLLQF